MCPDKQDKKEVQEILRNLKGIEPLKELFCVNLNYDRVNKPIARRGWSEAANNALAEDPLILASSGEGGQFHIIYNRLISDKLRIGDERPVVTQLLKEHPYSLFVFSNNSQERWHFINVKIATTSNDDLELNKEPSRRRVFRRITIGPEERLRTASERISMLDTEKVSPDLFGLSALAIQKQHDTAFDVEAVTKAFYEEYKAVFKSLENDLIKQTKDRPFAHDYSLQFLNRCMFIYFVQRKRWLDNDPDFFCHFWEAYNKSQHPQDYFVENWLEVLFFEAFNKKAHDGYKRFPENILKAILNAPYLNGGLFEKNELDHKYAEKIKITDNRFRQIINFLERYNFTVSEDTPFDQEVAVDDEMLGKVYESLVNVSEEIDQRGEAGIFYTPRTEIDLMCRLSIVDFLTNHLGEKNKKLLYEMVFALTPEEKQKADDAIQKAGILAEIDNLLQNITTLDPACGSGSFLVGMLIVLDDLICRLEKKQNREESSYERRRRIIGQSLYGVDVMKWAVDVAELRLWLKLVIESDLPLNVLQHKPLLPNLSFKIRQGDSLVQEVAGINLGHIKTNIVVPSNIKAQLTSLKNQKMLFYNNDKSCRYRNVKEIEFEERNLFLNFLEARIHSLNNDLKKAINMREAQTNMFGEKEKKRELIMSEEVENIENELEKSKQALAAVKKEKTPPFAWDIAFVEIFSGDNQGFDIVIANPPYVRKENISDPTMAREEVTTENKREYKDKLIRSIYMNYPYFFGRNPYSPDHTLDARSDLYVFFYFHGLRLLNEKGSLCFITSNSWLDVGYGADLQEFLLKHSHVKMIIDNQVKRSFASADVNTIIVLLAPPSEDNMEKKTARFVMFRVPFDQIMNPLIFEKIEEATERKANLEYRVFPIKQDKLFEDGCELPDGENEQEAKGKKAITMGPLIKVARYIGNKWGGKYLRAPEIFWEILNKGCRCLVKLRSLCTVQGYIHDNNTGSKYPPALFIKSIRDINQIQIDRHCQGVVKYGVKDEGNSRVISPILFPRTFGSRHLIPWNTDEVYFKEFYKVLPNSVFKTKLIAAQLNSSFAVLQREIIGLVNLGEGAIKFSAEDIGMFLVLDHINNKNYESIFANLARRPIMDIPDELEQSDRRELDSIIFDEIGISNSQKEMVYEAIRHLIEARLKKAESV